SDEFAVRERATEQLRLLGAHAADELREAAKSASLEVRRRAERLLGQLAHEPTPPGELRVLRILEILEWIDTPKSGRLLGELRKGGSEKEYRESGSVGGQGIVECQSPHHPPRGASGTDDTSTPGLGL